MKPRSARSDRAIDLTKKRKRHEEIKIEFTPGETTYRELYKKLEQEYYTEFNGTRLIGPDQTLIAGEQLDKVIPADPVVNVSYVITPQPSKPKSSIKDKDSEIIKTEPKIKEELSSLNHTTTITSKRFDSDAYDETTFKRSGPVTRSIKRKTDLMSQIADNIEESKPKRMR